MDKDLNLIRSIIMRCEEIEEAMDRFGNTEEDFNDDWMYQYTCSFCLSQIGEAAGKLSPELIERYTEVEWKKSKRMRDFLTHSYHNVEMSVVWNTITQNIPAL